MDPDVLVALLLALVPGLPDVQLLKYIWAVYEAYLAQ
jgi:hypothetical protein